MKEIPIDLKVTALYELLKEAGGHFVPFAGFYMPLNFTGGIINEHLAVRTKSGFFDISHMGEILFTGKEASKFLNYVATNNISKASDNQMQYNIVCQEDGGAIDDMMVYKYHAEKLLLVCNASNTNNLLNHFAEVLKEKEFIVNVQDISDAWSAVALQGRDSKAILEDILKINLSDLAFLRFKEFSNLLISNSGYTGEKGYEIFGPHEEVVQVAKELLERNVAPCGLGSRDTLRFEAGLPLYGHELSEKISPVEARLGFALDFTKEDFIGKTALLRIKEDLRNKIYGMELLETGIARAGYEIYDGEELVGFVTSGFIIPGTKKAYANALLRNRYIEGDTLEVVIRNKRIKVILRKKKYINGGTF